MGSAILHLLQASPCLCQDGAREVPITRLSTMRQATEVFQKRLPFESRIKASKQFQLILSSSCMLFVYTAGWLSTCAQGNVKPPAKKKKGGQKTNPPRSFGNQRMGFSCAFCYPRKAALQKDFLTHRLGPRLPCKRLLGLLQHIPGV